MCECNAPDRRQPIATIKDPMTDAENHPQIPSHTAKTPHPADPMRAFMTPKGEELERLADGLPSYEGWTPYFDYPGFINYSHPDSDVIVCCTPDFNKPGIIDIQVQYIDGRTPKGKGPRGEGGEIPFPVRTSERLFAAVQPWLDVWKPLPKLTLKGADVIAIVEALFEFQGRKGAGSGGPEDRILDEENAGGILTIPAMRSIFDYYKTVHDRECSVCDRSVLDCGGCK